MKNTNEWYLWPMPFFEEHHSRLASGFSQWQCPEVDHDALDLEPACRRIAASLGDAGILDVVVPRVGEDGARKVDLRAACAAREAVAYQSVLADEVLAMQGIGTAAIWLHGTTEQQERYLEPARRGEKLAAFALTEPGAGSDVANLSTVAEKTANGYVLNGAKALISNAPFADFYIVVARTGEAAGSRGLTAFVIDRGTPGLIAGEPVQLIAPHPIAPISFENCHVGFDAVIGQPGNGFKIAMSTFDIFRTSVGAAGLGMGRRAFDETLKHTKSRSLFGDTMTAMPGVQTKLADMIIDLETAALVIYRAAWSKDVTGGRRTREASMAKLIGTENASRVIDNAVQLFGGRGVTRGSIVEQLYRDVRPSRIYEGASEVMKLVIARDLIS